MQPNTLRFTALLVHGTGNFEVDAVACRLVAACGVAHQVDAHGVVPIRGQGAGKVVARCGTDKNGSLVARREDVEIDKAVARLQRDLHGLSRRSAQPIIDTFISFDVVLEHNAALALLKLYCLLPDGVVCPGRRGLKPETCQNK